VAGNRAVNATDKNAKVTGTIYTGGGPYKITGEQKSTKEVTKGRKGTTSHPINQVTISQGRHAMDNPNLIVGYIDLRVMCGKGFNVAGGLRAFITAGHAIIR
jgi:hypothetical protein